MDINIVKCQQCFPLGTGTVSSFILFLWAFSHFSKITQVNVYNLTEKYFK